jgi:spoIIIJ-associated protein
MSHEGDVFEGKTLDAAVKTGLEALGLSRAEVMITILEEGSSGFLGIGARPYRVRVMRRPGGPPLAEPDAEARRHRGSGRGGRGRVQGEPLPEAGRGAGRDRRERREERRGERRREGQGEARGEARGDRQRGRRDERRGERRDERRGEHRDEPRGEHRDERGEERRDERRGERPDLVEAPRLETAAVRPQAPGGPEEDRRRRRRGRRGGRKRHEGPAGAGSEATRAPEQRQAERRDAEPGVVEAPAPAQPGASEAPPGAQPPRHAEPQSGLPEAPSWSADELAAQSRRLTEDLLRAMGFEGVVSATVDGNHVEVTAEVAKDEDLLTGRKGEVRQALQHLLNRMLNRGESSRYHLQLEINDFWKRREEELRELARSLAEEAVASGGETMTEYLNAQERRIVHVTLREDSRVKTYALGTGMIKRVAIAPADFEGGPGGESE